MKKKGISLILLVITIIIIIIIASAVILNLNNNNPVDKARLANIESTRDSLKSGINLYIGKIMVEENGNHRAQTMILGKNDEVEKYKIITGDYAEDYETIFTNKQIWQLDYAKVKELVNIKLDIYDNNSRWYIDEWGNPYLVYDKLSNVSPYLKDETGNVDSKVRDFVVYLDKDIEFAENIQPAPQEPEEDLTSSIAVTKNSNSTATISGFSRNGIKSITYTGPRQGTLTPTVNGNYYTAVANVGNGDYTFTITDNNDEVEEIEETISGITSYAVSSTQDLCRFRDYVNQGDDFAGVTVTQTTDLDLSSVCGANIGSFTPIGDSSALRFGGTYDGNYHKITNLYIDINETQNGTQYVGMFKITKNTAIIQNILMDNVYVNSSYSSSNSDMFVGGIVGNNKGIIRNCGIDSGTVRGENLTNPTAVRYVVVGGICAMSSTGSISNCYNNANVIASTHQPNSNTAALAAGICTDIWNINIDNCYNAGTINASGSAVYISGVVAQMYNGNINNCYNCGTIISSSSGRIAGIVAVNGINSTDVSGTITNSYCTTDTSYSSYDMNSSNTSRRVNSNTLKTYASTLGDAYKDDENNINNGYPILTWQ